MENGEIITEIEDIEPIKEDETIITEETPEEEGLQPTRRLADLLIIVAILLAVIAFILAGAGI